MRFAIRSSGRRRAPPLFSTSNPKGRHTKRASSSAIFSSLSLAAPSHGSRTFTCNLPPNRSASRFLSNLFAAAHSRKPALSSANARMEPTNMAVPGFGEIAEQLRRSTVLIHAGGRGAGSGIIWSSDGLLVTNAHVVRGSHPIVQLWDGREFEAVTQSRDPRRDLAQLRIDAAKMPAASPADSSRGRPVGLAIPTG